MIFRYPLPFPRLCSADLGGVIPREVSSDFFVATRRGVEPIDPLRRRYGDHHPRVDLGRPLTSTWGDTSAVISSPCTALRLPSRTARALPASADMQNAKRAASG